MSKIIISGILFIILISGCPTVPDLSDVEKLRDILQETAYSGIPGIALYVKTPEYTFNETAGYFDGCLRPVFNKS